MTKMKGGPADSGGPVEVPEQLPILPLRNSVLFPGSIIPIDVGRRKSVRLVEEAISRERPLIGIVTQRDARTEDPTDGDMYEVGCAARILKVIKLAKDNFSVILQGISRIRIAEYTQQEPFIIARVAAVPDPTSADVELDELDESGGDLEEFKEKIAAAKMPPDTEKVALKQYERLKVMQPSSAEYTVTRTYLEWLVELPWSASTEDKIDIPEARDILNADHYDLDKVKKRILEFLAVRKLKSDKKGPILCLVGPPGVGKTSLGK